MISKELSPLSGSAPFTLRTCFQDGNYPFKPAEILVLIAYPALDRQIITKFLRGQERDTCSPTLLHLRQIRFIGHQMLPMVARMFSEVGERFLRLPQP